MERNCLMSEEKQNRIRKQLQEIFDDDEDIDEKRLSGVYNKSSKECKIADREARKKAKEMIDKCKSFALVFDSGEHHGAICGISDPLMMLRAINKTRADLKKEVDRLIDGGDI